MRVKARTAPAAVKLVTLPRVVLAASAPLALKLWDVKVWLCATFSEHMAEDLAVVAPKLDCVDELGTHLGLTRLYGRALLGESVVEATPGYSGPPYTENAALRLRGVCAPYVFDRSTDGLAFEIYAEYPLAPKLCQGDIVLIDNLASHRHEAIRTLIEARGATVEFLPPYSPDPNPIEKCFSKVKTWQRKAKARTFDELIAALADALHAVSKQDAAAWFAH